MSNKQITTIITTTGLLKSTNNYTDYFSRRRRSDQSEVDCENDLKIKRYNGAVDEGYELLLDTSRSKRIYFLTDRIFDTRLYDEIGTAYNQMKQKITENRKHLSNVRVVQKNLVFVVGLSPRLADPEVLKKPDYFGKFGKIHKVVINHSTQYAGSQLQVLQYCNFSFL